MTDQLKGRTALITGASQGLGLEIARTYLREGARIVISARSQDKLTAAEEELREFGDVATFRADAASAADVNAVTAFATERFGGLDILVNNAGVYGPKGATDDVDWDEWIRAIEINLMGSVLHVRAALPQLRASERGKVVQLSGGGATAPLPFLSAYAVSKAAIVRFAETLAGEEPGIDVNCIAPGALNTGMLDEVLEAGPDAVGHAFYEKAVKQRDSGGTPLSRGSELAAYLGSRASDGFSGRLISAVWDPWETLHEHNEDLAQSDIYTLRRIVPDDRGQDWGERE